jgi:ABC-type multidrug transport system permease subunit
MQIYNLLLMQLVTWVSKLILMGLKIVETLVDAVFTIGFLVVSFLAFYKSMTHTDDFMYLLGNEARFFDHLQNIF